MLLSKNPRSLRKTAARAIRRGKHKKALEAYRALERMEPTEGEWARRVATMCERLGRGREGIAALERALVKYTRSRSDTKADAVRALIERLDPAHAETQKRLVERHASPAPKAIANSRRFAVGTEKVESRAVGVKLAWAYHHEISKNERVALALSSLEPEESEETPAELRELAVRRRR